jgi:hypothetical protein
MILDALYRYYRQILDDFKHVIEGHVYLMRCIRQRPVQLTSGHISTLIW